MINESTLRQMVTSHKKRYTESGYSLLEVVTVIAVVAILASIGIPNAIKYLYYTQIEQGKSWLNSASSECLQLARSAPKGTSMQTLVPTMSLSGLNKPYSINQPNGNCADIEIVHETKYLPSFGIIIEGGKVFKKSVAYSNDTKDYCSDWGGCKVNPAATALTFNENDLQMSTCLRNQRICDQTLASKINNAGNSNTPLGAIGWSGNCSLAIDPATNPCTCNKEIWVCKGSVYYSQNDYNKCKSLPPGPTAAQTAAALAALASGNPYYQDEDYYWVNGIQVDECNYQYEIWKGKNGSSGSYAESQFIKGKCLYAIPSAYKCSSGTQWKIFEGTNTKPPRLTC